ncbi:hypothetical protein [Paenibacillus planticolens]|uniref:Uncharacterized protein n=1 Tax=Paenibacillus planticolens TaxID=2654976 RepID=A0ABX1ZR26_9BACL|nr:hypothetical protein [Paenibacillus planticolens]NOV01323.1 hypothetical protein [Paenibacillus planticolens]
MKSVISFRLRKHLDADLISAISQMDETILKDLCRDGLRLMLGIRTTKQIEVTEKTLNIPARRIETNPDIPSQGTKQHADPQRTQARPASIPLTNNKKGPANNAGTHWTPSGKK